MITAATIWCVMALNSSLESNAPKLCFERRETCEAVVEGDAYKVCRRRQA